MSKFMTLNKQVEIKAKRWFIEQQPPQADSRLVKKFFEEDKKEVIKEYLEKHPKVKKEYKSKKLKIKLAIGGLVAAATLIGTFVAKSNNQPEKNPIGIEQEADLYDNTLTGQENEEEKSYEEFFQELKETKNEEKREDLITNQTKEIIVEAYNNEHPENPITADRLETLILNENVLEKKDRLGNTTYERVAQNVQYEQTENQKLVKIGDIYDFRIDGKTVAVFDKDENQLLDKNVQMQDTSFKSMIKMVKQSEKLKDIYKYRSNDYEKEKVEDEYAKVANGLLEEQKEMQVAEREIEE